MKTTAAGCDMPPLARSAFAGGRRTGTTLDALPPGRQLPSRVPSRFEPCRGCPRYRSSPVCAGLAIKPLGRNPNGTCSLGQDWWPAGTAGWPVHPRNRGENGPFPFQINPAGISKRNEVLATMFFVGRAKARRQHWAGTPVDSYLKVGEAFAKP